MAINSFNNGPQVSPIERLLGVVNAGLDLSSKITNRKIDRIKLDQLETEQKNASSPLSEQERTQYQNFVGSQVPEGTTRAQAEKLYGPVSGYIQGQFKSKNERENRLAEIAASGAESRKTKGMELEADKPNKAMKIAENLRNERNSLPTTKATQQVAASIERVRQAADNPSAAGDVALIFNYMKMLDPGSTVREGEFATAQNAAGIPEIIRSKWNRVVNGERLAAEQRQDFATQAERQYTAQLDVQNRVDESYRQLAKKYGVAEDEVFAQFTSQSRNSDKMLAEKFGAKLGKDAANASKNKSGPHGSYVIQNGVRFTWNPKTGKYEP